MQIFRNHQRRPKTARTIAIREGEALRVQAFTRMIAQIAANNRAGGWRKLKR